MDPKDSPKKESYGYAMTKYQNFWCPNFSLNPVIALQKHFQAKDTDIFIINMPKTGTTWFKSLLFSTLNRFEHRTSDTPLRTHNPHQLIPSLEIILYAQNDNPDLTQLPHPRLFSTHLPYDSLPQSIKTSKAKIVYISRNPFDTFVSSWLYYSKLDKKGGNPNPNPNPSPSPSPNPNPNLNPNPSPNPNPNPSPSPSPSPNPNPNPSKEEYFDKFCEGRSIYGPFFEHATGYWKQSPEKVMFLRYEELKGDGVGQLKRVAEFIGCPFSAAEVEEGVVEEIVRLCSIVSLREMDVNKNGQCDPDFENKCFFRKGEVGDWVNHLTPSMVERLSKIMEEKLSGSGLCF